MLRPTYTVAVKRIADDVRKLTTGELIALREALAGTWDILPPDAAVREPRPEGQPPSDSALAAVPSQDSEQ